MDFFSFEEAALRLKRALGIQTDKDLSALLGLDVSAYNKRKARGSFPKKELSALAVNRPDLQLDVDYVLTGGLAGPNVAVALGHDPRALMGRHAIEALESNPRALMGHNVDVALGLDPAAIAGPVATAHAVAALAEEARLLAAFRAADSAGRAGILLAARGIAALARQDPGAYHDGDAAAAKKPAARKKAA